MTSEVLDDILRRNRTRHPEFRQGLSNHLSMAARSLAVLGGSDAQLNALVATLWPRLEMAKDAAAFPADGWQSQIGNRARFGQFRATFEEMLRAHGPAETLRTVLPVLMPGVGAGAFHGLIRAGYGIRFEDRAELADGLAYWAIAHQPLGRLTGDGHESDPLVLLRAVHDDPALGREEIDAGLIFESMEVAAMRPGFAQAASALRVDESTLTRLADAVIRLYAASGDFTSLHAVTATHAMRLLAPYTQTADLRWFWQALVAAYVTIGAPAVQPVERADVPAWDAIVTAARVSRDEHDLKLVDIARDEESVYGGPWYRQAAALRLGMLEES